MQRNWSAAISSKKWPKEILISCCEQAAVVFAHMLVHIVIKCFYRSLVSKTIFPYYCFSPNYFFPTLHAAEKFGKEALGKPGEEL